MALTVGTDTKFYFDGNLIATESTPSNIQSTLLRGKQYLGGTGSNKEVTISQLSLFNKELSQQEITSLYNFGSNKLLIDKTYKISLRELQIWSKNQNITNNSTITYSGITSGDSNTIINSNIDSTDIFSTDDKINTFFELELENVVDLSDIQSIIMYSDPNKPYRLSNSKIKFFDLFDREIEEIQNSSDDYSIYKYRGPDYLSTVQKVRNIRIETVTGASLDINELQVWANNHNYVQGRSENYIASPTHTFNLTGNTRSLTDKNSSNVLTLNGSPTFDNNGVNLTGSQYITIPQSILGFGTSDFTISLWIQSNSVSSSIYQNIFSFGYDSPLSAILVVNVNNSTSFASDAGEVYFHDYGTIGGVVSETNFIYHDGNVHNYIITKKGSTLKIYIDSVEKVSTTRTASFPDQDYHIGYSLPRDGGNYLNGIIKRLDIWKGTGFD